MSAQGGNVGAVYESCARRLRGYVLGMGLKPEDAEDAVHDVFKQLMARDPAARKIDDVGAWLFGTARHVAAGMLRRRRSTVDLCAEDLASEPECLAETEETRKEVRKAVRALPKLLRTPLLLRHRRGWSCDRIAERLDLTANAVSLRLRRAREMLRARLGPLPRR